MNKFFLLVPLIAGLALAGCPPREPDTTEPTAQQQQEDRPSDGMLSTYVTTALAANPNVGVFGIEVEVQDGVVTLSGEVDNEEQIGIAEAEAAGVDGVVSVVNNLVARQGGGT
jgi:osmotically-inducible protein OsmY